MSACVGNISLQTPSSTSGPQTPSQSASQYISHKSKGLPEALWPQSPQQGLSSLSHPQPSAQQGEGWQASVWLARVWVNICYSLWLKLFKFDYMNTTEWTIWNADGKQREYYHIVLLETVRQDMCIFFLSNVLYLVMLKKKEMSWFCIIIPIQYNSKKEHQDGERVTDECGMQ